MKDVILELIVKFSESENPLETGITLITDGFLVSGFIVSKEKYMEHNVLTSSIEKGIQEAISREQSQTPEAEDDGERNFIHLRDAKYFTPGQPPIPGNEAVFCRIRLEKVSGFSLGVLGA